MALQGSGAISLSQVQSEFTGANPISMSEYYRGGSYVPTSVGGAAGAWSGYTGTTSYTFRYSSFNITYIYWAGALIGSVGGNITNRIIGSYEYNRGSQFNYVAGTKNDPESFTFYAIRRRTTATSVTVNTGIPASGAISMSQFYGGRKT